MSYPESGEEAKNKAKRPLYFFLITTLGTGALASLFTAPAIPNWYAALNKPPFTPPDFLLAPIWTGLYILMAVAGWRTWKRTGMRSPEMAAFGLQLALNFIWSVVLFGLHRIGAALAESVLLDLASLATLLLFFRRDRWAGLLFLPILAWMLYASLLTGALWRLN